MALAQRTCTPSGDTYLHSLIGANFGTLTYLQCGYVIAKSTYAVRPLVRIELSGLPATFRIIEAELWMYCTTAALLASPAGIHAIGLGIGTPSALWVETEATWNIYKTGSNWVTPGGDFAATPFATFNLPTGTGDVKVADGTDFTDGVIAFRDETKPFNVLLKRDSETLSNSFASFASRDHGTAAWRPRLILRGVDRTVCVVGGTRMLGGTKLAT